MHTILKTGILINVFLLVSQPSFAHAGDKAPLKTVKVKKAKKPPIVETLRLGCPVRWEVTSADGGKTHLYTCPTNHVEVSVLADTPVGGAFLDGSVKGDKFASWYR
ncbi:hypothetical protein KW797_00180 [Candidatus Parcubacteria bacterium]|nr:hypothetical protein [Candidatus Parcubacteria bacterium]